MKTYTVEYSSLLTGERTLRFECEVNSNSKIDAKAKALALFEEEERAYFDFDDLITFIDLCDADLVGWEIKIKD